MGAERLLLITLLLKLGVMAAIAAVLVRSVAFQRYLYNDDRNLAEKLYFALFLSLPLAGGVMIRLAVPAFQAADLSVPGALLLGLTGGYGVGIVGGAAIALPAVLVPHEWLALPMIVLAGTVGGLLRHAAPNQEEVWAFSPFIDLELWRWLRNRLDRPFRDWQALVFALVTATTLLQLELRRAAPRLIYADEPHSFATTLAVLAANILAIAIPIKIWNNTRIERKLEAQRRLLVQARLDALTSQINPHFLFNTLNSVASLVRFDPDTARVLIVKLSNILRRMLRKHESHLTLREELAFTDDYLDIEVVRFGLDKLRVVQEVDADTLDTLVPSMLLQPVIENSIRHGLAPKIEGGWVAVRAHRSRRGGQNRIELEVEDNGVGLTAEHGAGAPRPPSGEGHGIGLANIRERLRVLYGDAASFEIRSRSGGGTLVHISLPAEEVASTPAGAGSQLPMASEPGVQP